MFGQIFCHIINKPAKDGMVFSRTVQEFDHTNQKMGKEEWIPCLKWKEGCRKCQSSENQYNDAQPKELHE